MTPSVGDRRSAVRPLVVAVAGVLAVLALGLLARGTPLGRLDLSVVEAANRLHTGVLARLGDGVYAALEPVRAVLITVVVVAVVWWRTKDLARAGGLAVVVAVTWLSSAVVKVLVARPRPDVALLTHPVAVPPTEPSYPSGHTAFVVALAVGLFLVATSARQRRAALVGGVVATLAVAVLLVVDGVHHPTDVLASVVWSLTVGPTVMVVWTLLVTRFPALVPGRRQDPC